MDMVSKIKEAMVNDGALDTLDRIVGEVYNVTTISSLREDSSCEAKKRKFMGGTVVCEMPAWHKLDLVDFHEKRAFSVNICNRCLVRFLKKSIRVLCTER